MRLQRFGGAALALCVGGCGAGDVTEFHLGCSGGGHLEVVSGDNQTAAPGAALPEPLVVRFGVDAPSMFCTGLGARIEWSVVSGGGTVTGTQSAVGPSHSARWVLGPEPGEQNVRATWVNAPNTRVGLQVSFRAFAKLPE
jgi:hypothetical protein